MWVVVCYYYRNIIGGRDGSYVDRAEVLQFVDGDEWKEVGQLQTARTEFTATRIKIDGDMRQKCK